MGARSKATYNVVTRQTVTSGPSQYLIISTRNRKNKDGNPKLTTPEATETPVLYSHPECDFSNMLKEELDGEGVKYTEIDMSEHEDLWSEVEKLTGGDRTTPVLVRNGEVEVGYHGIG
ncbi:MAG: glutaredoxin [Chloroflexi bacterium]|nr:glutaredoxin [Chloroflexota bacterium]